MKFAILTSVVLFGFIIQRAIRRSNHMIEKEKREFWEREERADHTPPSSTDNLNWIHFPEGLPIDIKCSSSKAKSLEDTLSSLKNKQIVNLSSYSNTELKLAYGTENITVLSRADSNYLVLMRTLDSLAEIYKKEGFDDENAALLQFAVDSGSESVQHFEVLAEYYFQHENINALRRLQELSRDLPNNRHSAVASKLDGYLNLMEIFND